MVSGGEKLVLVLLLAIAAKVSPEVQVDCFSLCISVDMSWTKWNQNKAELISMWQIVKQVRDETINFGDIVKTSQASSI
jgi:hypothetical protein